MIWLLSIENAVHGACVGAVEWATRLLTAWSDSIRRRAQAQLDRHR